MAIFVMLAATRVAADDREVVEREVSPVVAERLKLAAKAIRFVKRAIPAAGNQHEPVWETKGNSWNRMKVTRRTDIQRRVESPELKALARNDQLAAKAATIACTSGGNCGEHATMSLQYLAGLNTGQPMAKASVRGVDHAFVLIGDLKNDPLHEIVVVDTWVNKPQPLLWTDFSFQKDRSEIRVTDTIKKKGKETRQARRELTRGLRASFKKNPEPQLKATVADTRTLSGMWFVEHASAKNMRYMVRGEDGKLRPIKYTSAERQEPAANEAANGRGVVRTLRANGNRNGRRIERTTTSPRTSPRARPRPRPRPRGRH